MADLNAVEIKAFGSRTRFHALQSVLPGSVVHHRLVGFRPCLSALRELQFPAPEFLQSGARG
jgi:hypothetical protein